MYYVDICPAPNDDDPDSRCYQLTYLFYVDIAHMCNR